MDMHEFKPWDVNPERCGVLIYATATFQRFCGLPQSAECHQVSEGHEFKRALICHSCGKTQGSDSFECGHCGSMVTEIVGARCATSKDDC